MIFNIDTYYNYGNTPVGHHIDMISRDLIPSSYGWQMRTNNTNNGTSSEQSPFLASTNMINKLNTYFSSNIPSGLQSHIINKRCMVPTRYTSGSTTLTDDNSYAWKDLPKLWLPYEIEVYGIKQICTENYQQGLRQYPTFKTNPELINKNRDTTNGRGYWWLASAFSGNYISFDCVYTHGCCDNGSAAYAGFCAPLCFRFQ